MREADANSIVDTIADGGDIDWTSVDDAGAPVAQLRRLDAIARAFRGRTRETSSAAEVTLFEWRHLQVRELIGKGGFGKVYRAYDPMLRRDVALKLAHDRLSRSRGSTVIAAEARRMARVRHPNILAIHGADEIDGQVGIWCDLLRGVTLASVLEDDRRLPHSQVLEVAAPLSAAIALIHSRGLSHGDIKPSNIMIQPDGSPVLMDFGAAVESHDADAQTVGSPVVMAPEQFEGVPASPASDVYALGVVLFRATTGRFPIVAPSVTQLGEMHAAGAGPVNFDDVPRTWRRLLRAMLHADPAERPSAREVVGRLDRMATAPARRRTTIAVASVVAGLAVAAVASLLAYRSADQGRQRLELVKDIFVESMNEADPQRHSGPVAVQRVYEALAERSRERLADYPHAAAEMQLIAGEGLGMAGDVERGLAFAEESLALMATVPEATPTDLAHSYMTLATLRTLAKDLDGAERATRSALQQAEMMPSSDAADMRQMGQNRLALLAGERGQWHREVEAHAALLAARRDLHGPESLRLAVDYHNLARAQIQLGDAESALANSKAAASLLEKHGDAESYRMGHVRYGIALAHLLLEDSVRSRSELDAARRLYLGSVPADHPSLLSLILDEARWAIRFGEPDAGFAQLQALLERDDITPHLTATTHRYFGQEAARLARWEAARTHYGTLIESPTVRYHLLAEYFVAAHAYARYQMGETDFPSDELTTAARALRKHGMGGLPETRMIEAWLQDAPAGNGHEYTGGPT